MNDTEYLSCIHTGVVDNDVVGRSTSYSSIQSCALVDYLGSTVGPAVVARWY